MLLPKTNREIRVARHLGLIDDDTPLWACNGYSAIIPPYRCIIRSDRRNGFFRVCPVTECGDVLISGGADLSNRDVCTSEEECMDAYLKGLDAQLGHVLSRAEKLQTILTDLACEPHTTPDIDDALLIDAVHCRFELDMAPKPHARVKLIERLQSDIATLSSITGRPLDVVERDIADKAASFRKEGNRG